MEQIPWQELEPDEQHLWLTEGMRPEFATFLPMGTKQAKSARELDPRTMFKRFSNGVKTNRDPWVFDFDRDDLITKITRTIESYNAEVDRWRRSGGTGNIDNFVVYDDTRIKWSRDLKLDLQRGNYAEFQEMRVRRSLYRPFCQQWLFFDRILNEEVYMLPSIFPTPASEQENMVICVPGPGNRKEFGVIAAHLIPNLDLAFEKTQCFPLYTYAEDGSARQENITAWALGQFQAAYGAEVTRRDIFDYVYAVLHHPDYRARYAKNLKRELPRIPLVAGAEAFRACVAAGARLASLHVGYETAAEYPLRDVVTQGTPFTWRVEKMALKDNKTALQVNAALRLEGIPSEAFAYKLGNRSALEWVIDQYQVSADKRSGITTDPNRGDDSQYIARLCKRVITVSLETQRIVGGLPELGEGMTVGGDAAGG